MTEYHDEPHQIKPIQGGIKSKLLYLRIK